MVSRLKRNCAALSALASESDMEAHRSRQDLLSMTESLLSDNLDLKRRIGRLEHSFDASQSIVTHRADSIATTQMSRQHGSVNNVLDHHDTMPPMVFGAPMDRPFERVLYSSRVYHKAKRQTCDVSLYSSIGGSHAWTALSDVSLSDISNLSVYVLPIQPKDISNPKHYTFRQEEVDLDRQNLQGKSDELLDPISTATVVQLTSQIASSINAGPPSLTRRHRMTFVDLPSDRAILGPRTGPSIVVKGSRESSPYAFVGNVRRLH